MIVWNETRDTAGSAQPRAGHEIDVEIGTLPVEEGQSVLVRYRVKAADGAPAVEGERRAFWVENRDSNSYWHAKLGPFKKGERVEYWLEASSPAGRATAPGGSFEVAPRLWLALLWHQHQPLYRDTARHDPSRAAHTSDLGYGFTRSVTTTPWQHSSRSNPASTLRSI